MNRIILTGNGFDLAHNLPTSYRHFIDWYWNDWKKMLKRGKKIIEDPLLYIVNKTHYTIWEMLLRSSDYIDSFSGHEFGEKIVKSKSAFGQYFSIQPCRFLQKICQSIETKGWVDIENEYYKELVECSKGSDSELLLTLNKQFGHLQELLAQYLSSLSLEDIQVNDKIKKIIYSPINPRDISVSQKEVISTHADYWVNCDRMIFVNKLSRYKTYRNYLDDQWDYNESYNKPISEVDLDNVYINYPTFFLPDNIMVLNFNYTNLPNHYIEDDNPIFKVCDIHGKLEEPEKIIFGYGDDLDENYKKISNLNDNRYLTNFKSIKYLESDNYRKALQFMDAAPYQVFIMGHSCGSSDRTLLNTLFEHKNCVSIKPYYFKDGEKDNYLDIVQNISRNFIDTKLMRDRVVNKTYCEAFSKRDGQTDQ